MLEFTKHPVKILHLNLRTEEHGEDEVQAVDIKLGFDVPNTALTALSEGLPEALYDDPDLLGHLNHVRYPQLGTFKWAGEYSPVGLRLIAGNGRAKVDLMFKEVKVGKLMLEPKDGGTCACIARAQVHPSPEEVGKLSAMLKHEVQGTLDASVAVDLGDEPEEE